MSFRFNPLGNCWLYLAAVKDLYTCEIVGWSMDNRMTQTLVMDALTAAYWKKKPAPGLMLHSDRGSQYCSSAYRALQASYGMQTSMSRKGNCWDNTPMESFFGTIKTESLHHYRFKTRETAKRVSFEYIEVFYNRNTHLDSNMALHLIPQSAAVLGPQPFHGRGRGPRVTLRTR